MPVYVALLYAVNVLKHNRISMADLRDIFDSLGYSEVRTYIQSGNVVFSSPKRSASTLTREIESAIEKKLGKPVKVTLRTAGEMAKIAERHPFLADADADLKRLHVAFLSEKPDKATIAEIDPAQYHPDRFEVIGREVYLHFPDGVAETKLNTAFFQRKLKAPGTVRNWRTVTTLAEWTTQKPR